MQTAIAEPQATTQAAVDHVFFSKSGNLTFYASRPTRVLENGMSQVLEGKMIEFRPHGDRWGRLSTSDPEIVRAIEARRAEFRRNIMEPDVLTAAEYNDAVTTPEKKMEMLVEAKNEGIRRIESQNELIKELQAKNEESQRLIAEANARAVEASKQGGNQNQNRGNQPSQQK